MGITTASRAPRRGGRGARERILQAAARLFYRRGIHATGVAALTDAAHVSTRTFYQHFRTKNALVEAYLQRFEADTPMPGEQQLDRADLAPAGRLLAIFGPLESDPAPVVRGCPFHNAAVEAAGDIPAVADLVARHKRAFRDRLADVAAEAGAADPQALGAQLAVLYEGAAALSASCNDTQVAGDARRAAATLIQAGVGPAGTADLAARGHGGPADDLGPRAGAARTGHRGEPARDTGSPHTSST